MSRDKVAKTNQQPKSDLGLVSSLLQRAAIRSVPDKAIQPTENNDPSTFTESRFSYNFSRVPVNTAAPPMIQPKLKIGSVADKYEQEADRVARQVVSQIHSPLSKCWSIPGESVQQEARQEHNEEKFAMSLDLRKRLPTSPNLEQTRSYSPLDRGVFGAQCVSPAKSSHMVQRLSDGSEMATMPNLEAEIQRARGRGKPLPKAIREPMGQVFGADFSRVKVHTDAQSDHLNQSIQARAFTTEQDIFFRHGAYNPGNLAGQELIAHELTHVMQQNGSAVQREPEAHFVTPQKFTPIHSIYSNTVAQSVVQRNGGKSEEVSENIGKVKNLIERAIRMLNIFLRDFQAILADEEHKEILLLYFSETDISFLKDDFNNILTQANITLERKNYAYEDTGSQTKGHYAATNGHGAAAIITFNNTIWSLSETEQTITVIHELIHASDDIQGKDIAYIDDDFFKFLPSLEGLARKNPDSFAYALSHIFNQKYKMRNFETIDEEAVIEQNIFKLETEENKIKIITFALANKIASVSIDRIEKMCTYLTQQIEQGGYTDKVSQGYLLYSILAVELGEEIIPNPDKTPYVKEKVESARRLLQNCLNYLNIILGKSRNKKVDWVEDYYVVDVHNQDTLGQLFLVRPEPKAWMVEIGALDEGNSEMRQLFVKIALLIANNVSVPTNIPKSLLEALRQKQLEILLEQAKKRGESAQVFEGMGTM